MKTYTRAQMIKKYIRLTKDEKISVLWTAINLMQQFNGRSRFDCIFMSMGYEPDGEGWVNNLCN